MKIVSRMFGSVCLVLVGSLFACAAPAAGSRLGEGEVCRSRVCLNGEWEVAFSPAADGALSDWSPVRVPSVWGWTRAETFDYPRAVLSAKKAVYRLRFTVPEAWRGSKVRLFIEQVQDCPSVAVNGRQLWRKDVQGICETIDVTTAVRFGAANVLTVTTLGPGLHQGISGDVYVEAVPRTSLDHVLIDPSVRKGSLRVRTRVSGSELEKGRWTLESAVVDLRGNAAGRVVVTLPETAVGASGETDASVGWKDAELWGYGEYGSARFYWLRTRLLQDGRVVDVRHDRFGFREFWSEGDRFLFNGKPIFLRGDVYTRTRPHTDHPAAMAAFLHRMRASEQNFLRCHNDRFDNGVWFDATDDLGFLTQPEMWRPIRKGDTFLAADSEENRAVWRNYVLANYNHPSVISWCVDNESFSVGEATEANLAKIPIERVRAYDRLISSVRAIDPCRIVEINHNYCLWPFVKSGKFSRENFMTFNIHPYGNLRKSIDEEIARTGFKGEVPIVVGEVFSELRPVDFVQFPRDACAEQFRNAVSYETLMRSALSAPHVAGAFYCGESGVGYYGFDENRRLRYGPWDAFARPEGAAGVSNAYDFCVAALWPSLSGRGTKVVRVPATRFCGGNFGLHVNWFDPSAPVFCANVADAWMRRPFADLGALPPLTSDRPPEAVVRVAGGAGRFVYARPKALPGYEEGVMCDGRGTAWFHLPDAGVCEFDDGTLSRIVQIMARPRRADRAGYEGLEWIDLGTPTAPIRDALLKPPAKEITDLLVPGEKLNNRSFDYVSADGLPHGWSINDGPNVRVEPARDGKGGQLVMRGGKAHVTQVVSLRKGETYRISGFAEKRGGKGAASIHINTEDYKDLFKLTFSETAGTRERFDKTYVATGTERYFYIDDRFLSDDAEYAYDDFSIRLVASDARKVSLFDGGPFPLPSDGSIRQWLVLGPFPNRGDEVSGYEAAKTDFLAAGGGEAAYRPWNARQASAVFSPGFYWQSGTYDLAWHSLAFEGPIGSLETVSLPEALIATVPPSNVAAYLGCTLVCAAEGEALLGMGSDDGYVVWLNGKRIGAALDNRGAALDQERYRVRLRKGENRLLVKAIQEGGEWKIAARLTRPDGKPLQDVSVVLDDEPSLLVNGSFAGVQGWSTDARTNLTEGVRCLRVGRSEGQATQTVRLKPGHRYRVSGFVKPSRVGAIGVIGVRDTRYEWLVKLDGNGQTEGWNGLTGVFTAPGTCRDAYFYCYNWYVGDTTTVDYADVRLVDLGESDEPFMVSSGAGRNPQFVDGGRALVYLDESGTSPCWRRYDLATGETCEADGSAPAAPKDDVLARSANGVVTARRIHSGGTANLRFVSEKTGRTLFETKAANGSMQIGGCHSPVLSDDGRYAVYVSADIQPLADLVLVDLKRGKTLPLTTDHADNQTPVLAPDLGAVAFVALRNDRHVVMIRKLKPNNPNKEFK